MSNAVPTAPFFVPSANGNCAYEKVPLGSEPDKHGINIDTVKIVCIGAKACGPSQIYLVQYKPVSRFDLEKHAEKCMQVESRTVYEFNPKVCGIGGYGIPKKTSKPRVDRRQRSLGLHHEED